MKNTALTNPKKLGKEIIAAAIDKHKNLQSDKVLSQVNMILDRINLLTLSNNKIKRQLELCEAQLDAINKGEFTINQYSAAIGFNNPEINISWDETGKW